MPDRRASAQSEDTLLQGWKEIAAYLERDPRTAQRWETSLGLPVRRHGSPSGSVYAYRSEIDEWRAKRSPRQAGTEATEAAPGARPWAWAAGAAVLVAGSFIMLLRSPELGPVAEAGGAGAGVRTTEICGECEWDGTVSPDGRYLSETDWVTSGDIGIRDLQTGELRPLSDKGSWDAAIGEAEHSLFSPDGKQIAYSWFSDHNGELGYELRVIDAFGAKPQWRTIYYSPELRDIEANSWTADGRIFVWIQRKDWSVGLGFVTLATGELQVIRSLDRFAYGPKLSPNSRWIAYDAPANEGDNARDIHLLAADGSLEKRLTTHRANDYMLGFSPDSQTLLFASNRTGSYGLWGLGVSPTGEIDEPELLMRDLGPVSPLGVQSDGSFVYARSLGSVDLYRAELDLETGRLLSKPMLVDTIYQGSNAGPWLSPDGSRFAYFASPGVSRYTRGAPDKLIVQDLDSGTPVEIQTGGLSLYPYWDLDWSPDGSRIVLPAKDDQGQWGYYEADIAAKTTRKLFGVDKPAPIFWANDGRSLLYSLRETPDRASAYALMRLDPGDADPQKVYVSRAGNMARLAASPHRDLIAWRQERKSIKVMPVEGGKARTVFENTTGQHDWVRDIAWTPDGRALLLQVKGEEDGSESEIWIVPSGGGKARKTDLVAAGLQQLGMHPDGKTVFYQAGTTDTRIFKTENFLLSSGSAGE